MDDDRKRLAATLRTLIEEFGEELAHEEFKRLGPSRPEGERHQPSVLGFGSGSQVGDVSIGNVAETIISIGRVVYGRDPEESEQSQLRLYLDGLASRLERLPLRGIDDQLGRAAGIAMPRVYISLATTKRVELARGRAKELRRYYVGGALSGVLRSAHDCDFALPDQAIVGSEERPEPMYPTPIRVLYRAELAAEAAAENRHLVLLGDPGSGKSTFLNHLAWALARRNLAASEKPAPQLPGWAEGLQLLPLRLSLRALAGQIERDGEGDRAVYEALVEALNPFDLSRPRELLRAALHRGAAIVLLDGLDEVPLQRVPGTVASRRSTLRSVRTFCEQYSRNRMLITCRSRAFAENLRRELDWPVATLAPLTLGQMRAFTKCWYDELVQGKQLSPTKAAQLAEMLMGAIADPARPRLRAMAETPLLLTLMAVVLVNNNELPRDRPMLYERILRLLLGQWDAVREGQSMAQALDMPGWASDHILPLLSELSYQAHRAGGAADGRGSLQEHVVRKALRQFFSSEGVEDPNGTTNHCLDYMSHRSGLLLPDDESGSYTFAHLTLQEHCAGRHLLISPDPVGAVLRHRDDDRWREPIMLGLGVVQQSYPFLVAEVLRSLISPSEDGVLKAPVRRQRDLILAAEIGRDRDWTALRRQPRFPVDELRSDLRVGLAALLADTAQPLGLAERVQAGLLLGELGDPRFPVTLDEWRAELERAGTEGSYLCRVEAGSYIIGSAPDDPDGQDGEQPQHNVTIDRPFLIARYPITNAQWWTWLQASEQQAPAEGLLRDWPNRPMSATSWQLASTFCAWLSDLLGRRARLPSEREWEAAARGGDARRYPWGDEWHADRGACATNRDLRDLAGPAPVGCFPAGRAPCGALDMAGNVWEWTADPWHLYGSAQRRANGSHYVVRGGSHGSDSVSLRCAARFRNVPDQPIDAYGFRVVIVLE